VLVPCALALLAAASLAVAQAPAASAVAQTPAAESRGKPYERLAAALLSAVSRPDFDPSALDPWLARDKVLATLAATRR